MDLYMIDMPKDNFSISHFIFLIIPADPSDAILPRPKSLVKLSVKYEQFLSLAIRKNY